MIDFFQKCWEWVVTNKDNIVAWVTSANFLAFVTTFITLIKSIKSTNKNTVASNEVKEGLVSTKIVKEDVIDIKNVCEKSYEDVEQISQSNSKIENKIDEFVETFNTKINAMLEVQTIVYSTIKDDIIRNSVNSILIDAKHCDASAKAELQAQIEELRNKLADATAKIKDEVTETIDKVEAVIKPSESTTRRY